MRAMNRLDGMSTERIVFSRRSDQLGGRLNAMINAMRIADAFGFEFRFIWPRSADTSINDPAQLFNQAFLDKFEISRNELKGRPVLPEHKLISLSEYDARQWLKSMGSNACVEAENPFGIACLSLESADIVRSTFIECFQRINWSTAAHALFNNLTTWRGGDDLAAVHVRAGDIVTGGWRHAMHYEKYTPLPYVNLAIEQLMQGGAKQVLVVSDNSHLLAWLCQRYEVVITASEIIPHYGELPESLKSLADIVLLSRCRIIVGPPSSAFSLLAANLGCGRVTSPQELVPFDLGRQVLLSGIVDMQVEATRFSFLNGLICRDIVWYLDVFADEINVRAQLELAKTAALLDSDFVSIHSRIALAAMRTDDWKEAHDAASEGLRLAKTGEPHDDPIVEALATDITVKCFDIVLQRQRSRRMRGDPVRPLRLAGLFPGFGEIRLANLHRSLFQVTNLDPTEMNRNGVLRSLRVLVAMAVCFSKLSEEVSALLNAGLTEWDWCVEDIERSQPRVLANRRPQPPRFEGLARNIDKAAADLSRAIDAAFARTSLEKQQTMWINGVRELVEYYGEDPRGMSSSHVLRMYRRFPSTHLLRLYRRLIRQRWRE
jgi:hypothetical protein